MFENFRFPWRPKDRGGYTIKMLPRAGVLYRDGLGSAVVDTETGFGPDADLIFYSKRVYADAPDWPLLPDPERRVLVAERVRRALESDGFRLDVVE